MINSLYDAHSTTDFQQLLFNFPIPKKAPSNVQDCFEYFSMNWNHLVKEASDFCHEKMEVSQAIGLPKSSLSLIKELSEVQGNKNQDKYFRAIIQPTLADFLYKLESELQPVLGARHTLIVLTYVNGSIS